MLLLTFTILDLIEMRRHAFLPVVMMMISGFWVWNEDKIHVDFISNDLNRGPKNTTLQQPVLFRSVML